MISVVTPCLNLYDDKRSEYFLKMMDSIHSQTYLNIEHIVVDGGSRDGTLDLLDKYHEKGWIKHLISEKDFGIYSALNKGINLSCGEYIQIMNTDDYFTDLSYFQKSLDVLKKGEFDFVHADKIIEPRDGTPDYVKRGDERVAYFRMPFRHQTMIIKRNIFDEVGLFDESYEIAADYKFVLRMLIEGKKGKHFSETVLRSLDGGVSSDRIKCVDEVSRVLFESYGDNHGLTLQDCFAIYTQNISSNLFSKILNNIENVNMLHSLEICYRQS